MSLNFAGGLNIWAILVSGLASMVIGFLWHGPLFGKAWVRYTGWTEEKIKALKPSSMTRVYLLAFATALVAALALAWLARATGASGVKDGLVLGALVGIGFAATAFATNHLFERKPVGLWLIAAGYQVAYLMTAGVIVTIWR